MNMIKQRSLILTLSVILLTAAACSGSPREAGILASQDAGDSNPAPTQTPVPQAEISSAADEGSAPDPQAAPTATPDIRLKPEQWQEWPVIPTVSPRIREVFSQGITLGNRANAFSKVGDCQIIPDVFLGIFDDITYSLPDGMESLQGTLDRFQGSFAREGYALKGGFVFPTVFSPLRADSSVCEPGETPYECELRINHPAFVLISMEFRYDGRTAEIHESYLRRAVEYALARGIVPIVATKADNFEGDHSLNLTTARIAYEYEIPLWNYWKAVQYLPGHGIDWERDSYGFHVTPEAWLVRSESFLKVLDALVKELEATPASAEQ